MTSALDKLNMVTLWKRREKLCAKLFNSVVNRDKNLLHSRSANLHVRKAKEFYIPNIRTNRFRNTLIIFKVFWKANYS